jgi:hypothetical protein
MILSESYETYKNVEELSQYRYRPNRDVDLALAKVGVFRTVPFCDVFPLMINNKLPESYLELEHDREYSITSENIQKNRIRSVKSEREIKCSGSRRQRRKLITKLSSSEIVLNEHSLKRLYQRSNLRGLTSYEFYKEPSGYVLELYNKGGNLKIDEKESTLNERQDLLYPFKSGAFLGTVRRNQNDHVETYIYDFQTGSLKSRNISKGMPVFLAHTFISYEMMSDAQKEVYNLHSIGNYQLAVRKMLEINPKESNLNKFSYFRCIETGSISSFDELMRDSDAA